MADEQEISREEDGRNAKKRLRERRDQEEDREGIAKKKAKKAQPGYKAEEMERETPNSIHLAVDVQMGATEEPKGASSSSSSSSSPPLQSPSEGSSFSLGFSSPKGKEQEKKGVWSLKNWLESLGSDYVGYTEMFRRAGFTIWDEIEGLTELDLDNIGIKKAGHRKNLKKKSSPAPTPGNLQGIDSSMFESGEVSVPGLSLKTEKRKPTPLLPSAVFKTLIGRKDPLLRAIDLVQTNLFRINSSSQRDYPIILTQGAPGTGKSRFLDELANQLSSLSSPPPPSPSPSSPSPAPRYDWGLVVVVPVTFNSNMEGDVATGEEALSKRILFSAFFESKKDHWNVFRDLHLNGETTLDFAISCVKKFTEATKVVLLVDELAKGYPKKEDLAKILDSINTLLGDDVCVIETALDTLMDRTHTSSNRGIERVTLLSLPEEECMSQLFGGQIQDPLLITLVSFSGGHPRSLELINEHILPIVPRLGSIKDAFEILETKMAGRKLLLPEANDLIVCYALGETVDLSTKRCIHPNCFNLECSHLSFDTCLKEAYFLNTGVVVDQAFRPRVSLLQLWFWCERNFRAVVESRHDFLVSILFKMLQTSLGHFNRSLGNPLSLELILAGDPLELIYACWEILHSISKTILKDADDITWRFFSCPCNKWEELVKFLDHSEKGAYEVVSQSERTVDFPRNSIVMLWVGKRFPGCDSIKVTTPRDGPQTLHLIESKFSQKCATTVFGEAMVEKKTAKMRTGVAHFLEKAGMVLGKSVSLPQVKCTSVKVQPENITSRFVLLGRVTNNLGKVNQILDESDLSDIFGPTLSQLLRPPLLRQPEEVGEGGEGGRDGDENDKEEE